jgi:PadR family transcriptional regulator, regulatory protein AphA
MSIEYAILGLLSWQPMSGYDLKKLIAESNVMYWSGNNNQIYRALVQLHEAELVAYQVQQQESLPAKKIYSITDKGEAELRNWVLSTPEVLEIRNTFLVQLAWADRLEDDELDELLESYEAEVGLQLRMQEQNKQRGIDMPGRTQRETMIWENISENIHMTYENELAWVRGLRKELNSLERS